MLTEKTLIRGKPLKYSFYMNTIFDKHHYFPFRCQSIYSFSQLEDIMLSPDHVIVNFDDGGFYYDPFH